MPIQSNPRYGERIIAAAAGYGHTNQLIAFYDLRIITLLASAARLSTGYRLIGNTGS